MTKSKSMLFGSLAATAAALITLSCSKSDSGTPSSSSTYKGSGSVWSASFDTSAKTFQITYDEGEDDTTEHAMMINGTYTEFETKVRKLTVTSSSGDDAPPAGESAYGIEIPGFAFFLKPPGDDREPIVMLQSGACPTGSFSANWMKASFIDSGLSHGPQSGDDAFGSADFTFSGNAVTSATIHQRSFGAGTDLGDHAGPTSASGTSCSNGVLSVYNGHENVRMYFTDNGGALVKTPGGIIFAAPKFTGATTADLAGIYTAIVFGGNKYGGTPNIFLGKITFDSSGNATGFKINPETDADISGGSGGVSIDLSSPSSSLGDGLFHGTIGLNPINCVLSRVNDQQLLACNGAGQSATGSYYNNTFFMLGVKR